MSLQFVLWLVAGILMAVAAFVSPPRISLATIAWALFILGFAASIAP
jgi:hypothetical protein